MRMWFHFQKNPFDRLFVASQSSTDIYSLLVPTCDNINTTYDGFFVEFELETAVIINSIHIFSLNGCYPRSFDIAFDGETVKSVKDAEELNGPYKDMIVNFDPIFLKKLEWHIFIIFKKNWTFVNWTKVFTTLVDESENKDPHKCPVFIAATSFDFNSFTSSEAKNYVWVYAYENQWFQIELTKCAAILNGFRIKRTETSKLKSYKLICTDDSSKPVSSWTTLIEIDEKTIDEHEILDIYKFERPSPPAKFVRLVHTGKNWDDKLDISFYNFDLFGTYF